MTSYLQSRFRLRRAGPGTGSYLLTRGAFRQPEPGFRDDRIAGEAEPPPEPHGPAAIALVTPLVGAASQLVVTASFTPVQGSILLAFGTFRRSATIVAPTCTDNLLSGWTLLATASFDSLSGSRNLSAVWGLIIDDPPLPMQVQVRSAGAAVCSSTVLQCLNFIDLPFGTDIATGTDATGDPTATLSPAPDASSWVVGFSSFNGTSAAMTTPTGFTQFAPVFTTSTNLQMHSFFDDTTPAASATYASSNFETTLILLELRPLP
jgi:hypothetical protein